MAIRELLRRRMSKGTKSSGKEVKAPSVSWKFLKDRYIFKFGDKQKRVKKIEFTAKALNKTQSITASSDGFTSATPRDFYGVEIRGKRAVVRSGEYGWLPR